MTEETTLETEETVAPDSENEDSTTSEEVTEVEETTETEDTTEETEEEVEKPKPKSKGFQKRINKLTREKRELESRIHAIEQDRNQPKADPVEAPNRDSFDSYEDFLEAKAEYIAEKKVSERLEKAQAKQREDSHRTEQTKLLDGWEDKKDDARERYNDFDDLVEGSDVPVTPSMSQALLESDIGADIAYYLANNEDEAIKITKFSPSRQLVEIGKLEVKVQASLDAPKKKAPSKAPDAIKPTKKKAPTGSDLPSDSDSMDDWARKERERINRKFG